MFIFSSQYKTILIQYEFGYKRIKIVLAMLSPIIYIIRF